jgi:hypothetical protein
VTVAITATATISAWTAAPAAAETWRWPVPGDVVADFANAGGPYADGQHRGVDVKAPAGTPVVAAAEGTVRFAGVVGSSGLTVSVRTADGRFDTSYLHLTTASVRTGQAIEAGDRIGAAGASGRPATAIPHVHFGIRDAGTRRYHDPLDFLPARPGTRHAPPGAPVAARHPVRVGPAPQPLRPDHAPRLARHAARPHHVPRLAHEHPFAPRATQPLPSPNPSRLGWAIACGALICAAALLGMRSSIDARAVLRHHTDLLRQR